MADKEMTILPETKEPEVELIDSSIKQKTSLDEVLVRNVLFSEKKKETLKKKEQERKLVLSPETQKIKNTLKKLIMEAWNELE
jgi:NADPH-dependent ferric siderophore reductase